MLSVCQLLTPNLESNLIALLPGLSPDIQTLTAWFRMYRRNTDYATRALKRKLAPGRWAPAEGPRESSVPSRDERPLAESGENVP